MLSIVTIIEWTVKSVTKAVFFPSLSCDRSFLHSSFRDLARRTSKKTFVSTRYMVEHFFRPQLSSFMLKSYRIYVYIFKESFYGFYRITFEVYVFFFESRNPVEDCFFCGFAEGSFSVAE